MKNNIVIDIDNGASCELLTNLNDGSNRIFIELITAAESVAVIVAKGSESTSFTTKSFEVPPEYINTSGTITITANGTTAATITTVDIPTGFNMNLSNQGEASYLCVVKEQETTYPLSVSNGGTGRSTLTSGYFLRGNGTSAVTMSSAASARSDMGLGNTTGALPVENGGTGAATANAAANNLCEVGTWTPTFECYDNNGNTTTAPTVTIGWRDAYYVRFGDFCYLYMGAAIGISNIGGGYAQIGGLPFEAYPLGYQGGICEYVYQCLTNRSQTEPVRAVIGSNAPNKVRLRDVNNVGPYQWKVNTSVGTNAGRLYFAFLYRIKS